jgi:phosphomannomutase
MTNQMATGLMLTVAPPTLPLFRLLSYSTQLTGFAFDGDADRVLAVDGRGRTVDGDYILYLGADLK